jgi:hypothetical protein
MSESGTGPAGRAGRLAALIERELRNPRPYSEVTEEVSDLLSGDEAALRFLRAKDDHHRHAFYVKSEAVWYRRFSWRIMRPLFVVSAVAAVGFVFQPVMDPALGLAAFILGGVCVYLAIQYFAHRWMRQNEERLREVDSRYTSELSEILDDLRAKE